MSGECGRKPYLVVTMQQPTGKWKVCGVISAVDPNAPRVAFPFLNRMSGRSESAERSMNETAGELTFVTMASPRR